MRRAMTTGLIGLAILLGIARPASAQWNIIKWLEELSGPGHFVLYGGEVHFLCDWKRPGEVQARESFDAATRAGAPALRALFCDQNRSTPKGSTTQVWKQARWFLAVQAAAGTGSNPLEYPADEKKDRTSAWMLAGGPVVRLHPAVDVGGSFGVLSLSGSTAKSTKKATIEPYVVIRPLAKANNDLNQYFAVRIGATIFPQGFTLEDFGATAGPLNGEAEVIFQIGFVFNFAYLGWNK